MKKKNNKKQKFTKIPISEFISDGKLKALEKMLKKSSDVDINYDRIEELLSKNYKVKDLGTNRLVLLHKDKKYKNLIFKVAGDSHGIEANYREFYNGDLDKSLTYSYSISSNGVFVVQERVERMTFDIMKERKKDVRKMLKGLSKKILLVDCKLENFKNFGVRKNGDVCLLDHGDTIPLPKYQDDHIINIDEESYVSLKCKRMSNPMVRSKDIKPCGGKLVYSKNFDYFTCEKCGQRSAIHDAYKEFYGDKRIQATGRQKIEHVEGYDPEAYKEYVRQYCIETMGKTIDDNKSNNQKEKKEMKTAVINGEPCKEIKGYFIPDPTQIQMMKYKAMKMGTVSPKDYLKAIKLDPDEYKISNVSKNEDIKVEENNEKEDNDMNTYNNDKNSLTEKIEKWNTAVAEYMRDTAVESGDFETRFTFDELNEKFPKTNFSKPFVCGAIRKILSELEETGGVVYNLEEKYFSVRIPSNGKNCYKKQNITEKTEENVDSNKKESTIKHSEKSDIKKSFKPEKIEAPVYEMTAKDEYIKAYAEKHSSTIVGEEISETESLYSLSKDDIDQASEEYKDETCTIIGKYFIPVRLLDKFYNDSTGLYEIDIKPKKILKKNNLSPKAYLISSEDDYDEEKNEQIKAEMSKPNPSIDEDIIQGLMNKIIRYTDNVIENSYVKDGNAIVHFDILELLNLLLLPQDDDDSYILPNEMDHFAQISEIKEDKIRISLNNREAQFIRIFSAISDLIDSTINPFKDCDISLLLNSRAESMDCRINIQEWNNWMNENEISDEDDSNEDKYEVPDEFEDDSLDESENNTGSFTKDTIVKAFNAFDNSIYDGEESNMVYDETDDLQFSESLDDEETNDIEDTDSSPTEVLESINEDESYKIHNSDINSYNLNNSKIESENKEEDDVANSELIDTMNLLIKALKDNTEAMNDEIAHLNRKLTNMSFDIEYIRDNMIEKSPLSEELESTEETAEDDTHYLPYEVASVFPGAMIIDIDELEEKPLVVRKGEKLIYMNIADLLRNTIDDGGKIWKVDSINTDILQ